MVGRPRRGRSCPPAACRGRGCCVASCGADVVDRDGVGLRAAGGDGVELGVAVLTIVRSMPVATCVVCVAVLLVSSASKIALFGSTVTVLVIGPTTGGATTTIVIVRGRLGGHRRRPSRSARCVARRRRSDAESPRRHDAGRRSCPAGSGSRTTTPVAARCRCCRPRTCRSDRRRQTGGPRSGGTGTVAPGHERAHTGSGESALVIVRSNCGLTVVSSVSVLGDALVLDVAGDRRGVDDDRARRADDLTRDRQQDRAAGVEGCGRRSCACGAVDRAAAVAADRAVGDDLADDHARRLEALRAVHDHDVVGAGRRVVGRPGSCR